MSPSGVPGDHSPPAILAYLTALEEELKNVDPRERAEILARVTERIDQALPAEPSDADVVRVLKSLGSVESIAAGATNAPVLVDQLAAIEAVPTWVLPTIYGLVAGSLVFVLLPFISFPVACAALAIALKWWKRTRAVPLKTAVVVASLAVGFAVVVVLVIIVTIFAYPVAITPTG